MMKTRFLFCITLLVHILVWFPATSRVLPTNYQLEGTSVSIETFESIEASDSSQRDSPEAEARSYRGVNQVGSRPPNCEHKCDGCNPCIAIQVPTITSHLGLQFANYEPESWKCKCGLSVYSP